MSRHSQSHPRRGDADHILACVIPYHDPSCVICFAPERVVEQLRDHFPGLRDTCSDPASIPGAGPATGGPLAAGRAARERVDGPAYTFLIDLGTGGPPVRGRASRLSVTLRRGCPFPEGFHRRATAALKALGAGKIRTKAPARPAATVA